MKITKKIVVGLIVIAVMISLWAMFAKASTTQNVQTLSVTNYGDHYATFNGYLEKPSNSGSAGVSFEYYRKNYTPGKYATPGFGMSESGEFSKSVTNLLAGTTYCYRAKAVFVYSVPVTYSGGSWAMPYPYACSGNDCLKYPQPNMYYQYSPVYASGGSQTYAIYGDEKCFTTLGDNGDDDNNNNNYQKPSVNTQSATNISYDSATLNGYLNDLGDDNTAEVWFEYKDHSGTATYLFVQKAMADDSMTSYITKSSTGSFSTRVYNLSENKTYYFRSVARNKNGIVFGDWKTFYTDDNGNNDSHTRPSISTRSATDVGYRYATLNGYLNDLGDDTYSNVWFEYGRTTSYGSETSRGYKSSTGNFSADISNLTQGVTYHFRAVGQNRAGTTYGSDYTFVTDGDNNNDDGNDLPYVITKSASSVGYNNVRLNGALEDLGRDNEASVWFEYGTTRSFGESTSRIWKSTEETFSAYVSGLENNQTYYFRAVAQNDYGKNYGSTYSFTTGDNYNNNYNDNGDDNYYNGTTFSSKDLSIDVRTKNQTQGGQYWSDTTYANPLDYINFRIDIRNNKSSRIDNVLVKISLSPNITYLGSIQKDGQYLTGDITQGINIGSMDAKQIETITFSARVKDAYNFGYGQNDLINVSYIQNSDPKIIESCKIIVSRTAVSGISINPSSIITGVGEDINNFVIIPAILALIVLVIFRKQVLTFFSKWNKSVTKAVDKSSQNELEKRIQEMTK
jgi:hypothetical protein